MGVRAEKRDEGELESQRNGKLRAGEREKGGKDEKRGWFEINSRGRDRDEMEMRGGERGEKVASAVC